MASNNSVKKSSKKDYIIIGGLILILAIVFAGIRLNSYLNADKITKIEVRLKDEVIKEIDLSVDGDYEIEVEHGHLHIRVENEAYYVYDVDCPDKICESVGIVKKGSEKLIVCLPNNIVIVQA